VRFYSSQMSQKYISTPLRWKNPLYMSENGFHPLWWKMSNLCRNIWRGSKTINKNVGIPRKCAVSPFSHKMALNNLCID
jgi:hypothetical protein